MTYNLARVFLFQQEGSLFLSSVTTARQAIFPAAYDILNHASLRHYADHGVAAIFSLLSYFSVVAGTHALCRKHFATEVSLAAALTARPRCRGGGRVLRVAGVGFHADKLGSGLVTFEWLLPMSE